MHSRIFQISKKPVEDRISEDRYYDDFVGRIADYVDELNVGGQLESIRWLAEATPGIVVKDAGDATATITIVDKKAYFTGKFEEFENTLRELGKLTLEQFATDDRDVTFSAINNRAWSFQPFLPICTELTSSPQGESRGPATYVYGLLFFSIRSVSTAHTEGFVRCHTNPGFG